ncbi:MAG: LPS export ABC transporter periplasmic protein LptC [Saprospiraceae bacterium]|nr:LPS export ABC transporter periplasmic protein LptC [Saprospiraceae bacterium]
MQNTIFYRLTYQNRTTKNTSKGMMTVGKNAQKRIFQSRFSIFGFLLPCLLFLAQNTTAQIAQNPYATLPNQPTNDSGRVQILNAKVADFILLKNQTAKKLKGQVVLQQKDARLFCDSAILDVNDNIYARGNVVLKQGDSTSIFADSMTFRGATRIADLYSNVILVNGEKKLFTQKLNYNLNTKVATYNTKSTLADPRTQLTSKRGSYNVATNQAFFKEQVLVVDKDFDLKTDTLKFDTKNNIATFLAPTLIYMKDSAQFYTEGGYYDLQKDNAEFNRSPQYKKKSQIALADTMLYDGKTTIITLKGHATTEDADKKAHANTIIYNRKTEESQLRGNAHFEDDKQNVDSDTILYSGKTKTYATRGRSKIINEGKFLEADFVDFDSKDSVGIAKGNVFWQDTSAKTTLRCDSMAYDQRRDYIKAGGGRPILTSLIDNDTLWLRADTIITFKPNPADTFRTMLAYYKVRMYKKNFQSVCDSLSYTQQDSLFRFFKDPIIWSDTSQLTADTMRMLLKDKKLDRVYMRNNGFIINSKDEVYFNQIKGRDITAFFENDDLRRMNVDGNAESVYYVLDDAQAYMSVNKMVCSSMIVQFGDNKVESIRFFTQPKATMTPMKQADHDALKMKGFKWDEKRRPKGLKDL